MVGGQALHNQQNGVELVNVGAISVNGGYEKHVTEDILAQGRYYERHFSRYFWSYWGASPSSFCEKACACDVALVGFWVLRRLMVVGGWFRDATRSSTD